ncbi:sensor histidine kinase [Pseudoflavonifractor phocaeensis]|uniref:sensor histidine kinase n=1 Tax=Oscillospiraceae TaxID=216572 RepID=UPI00174CD653|nr:MULTISPECIES: HAMP domain-containing sensor histidine kinase [Oscillospiraceae]MBM6721671.1 HAMP domain-containing histidine kinase [Pseudoflavonifractor phocaeensis]MBM6885107.1 HAMP domain-containing histidine kinase [Pseudoflavonifractor phocaeensis]
MTEKYTRLKLKMLLWVILGTLIAGAVGLFLLEVVVDGVLQDPIYRLFIWGAGALFGQSQEAADLLYQEYIRGNKQEILTLGTMVLMLIAFYVAMGRFTRWLDEIRTATRRLLSDGAEPVELPRELKPIQEDLNAIRRQLSAREAAARETEQRKGDLVAFLAHDLKTPLTSVVGYLTLLRDDPGLTAEQRAKFTGIALDKAQRLQELLGEFFDISKMDLDSEAGEKGPIQLSMLLEQLADEFYPLFAEKRLTCSPQIQPHLVVLGDPDKLARVFDNVLRNAVSYSTPGGQVDILAQAQGRSAEITIRNQGLEIPEGELSNIFEKFYRLDAARSSRTGGAGLGLAIAKEIVELHGGTIRCESNGTLTSFIISLPLHKEGRHGLRRNRAGLSEPK